MAVKNMIFYSKTVKLFDFNFIDGKNDIKIAKKCM